MTFLSINLHSISKNKKDAFARGQAEIIVPKNKKPRTELDLPRFLVTFLQKTLIISRFEKEQIKEGDCRFGTMTETGLKNCLLSLWKS